MAASSRATQVLGGSIPHPGLHRANVVNSNNDCIVRVSNVFYAFRYEGIRYILMQHIRGQDCSQDDFVQIALPVR